MYATKGSEFDYNGGHNIGFCLIDTYKAYYSIINIGILVIEEDYPEIGS